MKKPLPLAVLIASFVLTVFAGPARADEPTRVFGACTDDERIRFADTFPAEEKSWANSVIADKMGGPEIFRVGFRLGQSKVSWDVREMGEYLKARAYFREGLIHLAYQMFQTQLITPLQQGVPTFGRVAALECMLKIQRDFPTLGFGHAMIPNLINYMKRPDLDSLAKEDLAKALVIRMKEVVNTWDEKEANAIVAALGNMPGYSVYAQALMNQRNGQYAKAIPLWERIVEGGELPSLFAEDRDTLTILYARDLYEAKKYDKSADILRRVPRDSNYLAQALSDLSWALLQANKRREAIGAAFNIQKSLLTRVYAPEAPLVASIALHEMCQYARALKNAVFFKKKYYPVLIWYNKLTPSQREHPYGLLTTALRKKGGVPNLVLLEWLRSPEYRAYQLEANLLFDEKKAAYVLYSQRVNAAKGAAWLKEWKTPMPKFYNEVAPRQRQVAKNMNAVLTFLTNRIAKQVAKMAENVQLLEVEIFDHAGEDMVWRNVNPEYQAWLNDQPEEKRQKDLYWEWGSMPTDPKSIDEIWEDELGWTIGSVQDECKNKEKYREEKFGGKAGKSQAALPGGAPDPAKQ
ncbi:MAG: hypothetical protein JST04_06660 [Bdellovibrionales bacterium]|nr:hypothetical protein [Bdellovibrionales bacterium]